MRILIVSDADYPQTNGVVTTLHSVKKELDQSGDEVVFISPSMPGLRTFPLPTYPEIQLTWNFWRVGSIIKEIQPDAIHIATEGTLGMAARVFCSRRGIPFTSSYHTKTPEYIKERFKFIPLTIGRMWLRWLHKPSSAVLVTNESMRQELSWLNHHNLIIWSRGVDFEIFNPSRRTTSKADIARLLYVGRVSVEKNLEKFLELPTTFGEKIVVGDGPDRSHLEQRFPSTEFVGYKRGEELATEFANADVFVFPSRTDTFGIVMIEANACGTPVAAYPVTGPKDFIIQRVNGALNEDLLTAVMECLSIPRERVYEYVREEYTWRAVATIFRSALIPITHKSSMK